MSVFKDVTDALGALVEEKNDAYGDATRTGAEAMKALYPNGVKPEQYERFGYCLLVWHKLSRLATKPDAFGENPIHDIAGYSVLALAREKERAALAAEAESLVDTYAKIKQEAEKNPDGTVFGITAASYKKFKEHDASGNLPRPPLGTRFAPFEDLSKRWDAGVYEGTGKGYEKYGPGNPAPTRTARLGTRRGPLWASKEAAKETATKFADLFRARAPPVYKVGSHVPYSQVTLELQSKHTGYWLEDRRGLKERFWVITGVL